MMLDRESALKCIKIPSMEKFSNFTPQEKEALKEVICKIKFDQLCELSVSLLAGLDVIVEDNPPGLVNKVLGSITLARLNIEDLNKSARILLEKNEIDPTLKDSLRTPDESELYEAIYNVRHQFFLDKPSVVKNNKNAFPERMSERLLHKGHKHISMFLNGGSRSLSEFEKNLLARAYPLSDDQNNGNQQASLKLKTFRREAHLDIGLTLEEMQILITSMISKKLSAKASSDEHLKLIELSEADKVQLERYTKAEGMSFIAQGNLSEFKDYLLKNKFSVNEIDLHSGISFLCYAIKQRKLDFVTWLLSQGAKIDHQTHEGYSPLHFAAEIADSAFISELTRYKPQFDVIDRGGYPPIYVAAELGNVKCVNVLLAAGANPNLQNNRYRNTPFHIAVRAGKVDVIRAFAACYTIVRTDLVDKQGDTVLGLAKSLNNAEIIKIVEGNNKPGLKPAATALPPAPAAAAKAPSQSTIWQTIFHFGSTLDSAKEHNLQLSRTFPGQPCQSHIMPSFSTVERQDANISPKELFQKELSALSEIEQKFVNISSALQTIATSKATFAQAYQNIYQLFGKVIADHLSPLRFAEELCRFKLLKHLEELQENKTVLQVAIDGEELNVIASELSRNPDQQALVHHKGGKITILNYAILLGKTQAVGALLEAAKVNNNILLGLIPPNPLQLAGENLSKLQSKSAAFKEADDYFNVNIPEASKVNNLAMLHELRRTLPKIKKPIHYVNYFFVPEEYNLVKYLLNDKKDERPTSYFRKMVVGWIRLNRIKKIRGNLGNSEAEYEKRASLQRAEEYLQSGRIRNRHNSIAVPKGPKISNIYRHATKYIKQIEESGTLETVQGVLNASKIALVSTPEGSRNNIFFSPPGSDLTSLRSADSGIVEMDMAVAIEKKLLDESDFYTSSHLPAHRIEKIERSTVFIGEDPNTKTIFRVYHQKQSKIYIFEYYQDGVYIGFKKIEKMMSEEFFLGNNMRTFALRMVLLLRYIAGPLNKSYADYFYKNYQDPKIVDSLRKVLFDVMHVEGKIHRSIAIAHEAIKIVKNENPKLPPPPLHPMLLELIKTDEFEKFEKEIEAQDLKKDRLPFAVSVACTYGRLNFLRLLMRRGAPIDLNNNEPLRRIILKFERDYIRGHCKEDDSAVQNDLKIIELLLYEGTANLENSNHIRHVGSGDSFSTLIPGAWSKSTTPDLLQIAKFIFRFKQIAIQKLLLNSVYKHLEGLYKITATYGYYDLHNYIADRLGKAVLFATQPHAKLVELIDKENTQGLVTFLTSLPSLELSEYYYLLTNAIIKGKEKVVEALFPVLKSCELDSLNTSVCIALENKQPSIAKKLSDLGANCSRANILDESPIDIDSKTLLEVLPLDVVVKVEDIPTRISSCILRGQNDLIPLLCNRLQKYSLETYSQSLREEYSQYKEPLKDAIELENTDAFEMLVKHYDNETSSTGDRARFYRTLLFVAIKNKKMTILQRFFVIIAGNPKACKLVFGSFHELKATLQDILPIVTEDFFIAVLRGIKSLSKKKNILESIDLKSKSILQVIVATGKAPFVSAVLAYAPGLKFIPGSPDLSNTETFYNDYLFSENNRDDADFLKFLFDRGMSKPAQQEQVSMLMYALVAKRPNQIRWLFENKILDSKIISIDKKNILQMAIDAYTRKNGISSLYSGCFVSLRSAKNVDVEGCNLPNDLMVYLFRDLSIDPNHADESGNTLLQYDPTGSCHFARNFKEYLVENSTLNLNKFDANGNCILNFELREKFYLIAIDRYLKDGGNIRAVNALKTNFLECQLIRHRTKAIVTKLTEMGLVPRKCIFKPSIAANITTCYFNDKLYVLKLKPSNIFLIQFGLTRVAYRFLLKNQSGTLIDLKNNHLGRVSELPTQVSKKIPVDCEWVEVEYFLSLEKSENKKDHEEIVGYNLTLVLLKYISSLKNLSKNPEPGHLNHELSEEDSQKLFQEFMDFSSFMKQAYSSLLQGLLPSKAEAALVKRFIDAKLTINFLCLQEDKSNYADCEDIGTPFEFAVRSGQSELLANLYDQGYNNLAFDKNKWCFTAAFAHNDIRSLEILFDNETVTGQFIADLIIRNLYPPFQATKYLISKLASCKDITSKKKEALVQKLESSAPMRQTLLDALEQATKKSTDDQPKKGKVTKRSKVPIDEAEPKQDPATKKGRTSRPKKARSLEEILSDKEELKKSDTPVEEPARTKIKLIRKRTHSSDDKDVETIPKQGRPEPAVVEKSDDNKASVATNRSGFFVKLKRGNTAQIDDQQKKSQRPELEREERSESTPSESSSSTNG